MLVSMIKPCMRCVLSNNEQRSAHEGGGNFVGCPLIRITMTNSRLIREASAISLHILLNDKSIAIARTFVAQRR